MASKLMAMASSLMQRLKASRKNAVRFAELDVLMLPFAALGFQDFLCLRMGEIEPFLQNHHHCRFEIYFGQRSFNNIFPDVPCQHSEQRARKDSFSSHESKADFF